MKRESTLVICIAVAGIAAAGCGPSSRKTSGRAATAAAATASGGGTTGGAQSGHVDDHGNSSSDATPMAFQPPTQLSGPSDARWGLIDYVGDEDWFSITLEAGKVYSFRTWGNPNLAGRGTDTAIALLDPSLQTLMSNDDSPFGGLGAHIDFAARSSGRHYVVVRASPKAADPLPAYEVVVLQTSP
ncbi:MAG: PPC domain-containing protein [Planctomycetes bacterium]|nr:PPC domain-containing protein [Planctomycetota bacterium]